MTNNPQEQSSTDLPSVSVIMPIRNEAGFIERSLDAVLRQEYPMDKLEVIIADGMSTDGTREILDQFIRRNDGCEIKVLDNPHFIFPTGFNLGLKHAKGDVIVMLGGHTEIARDYIRRCVEHFDHGSVDCVGGRIDTIAETSIGQAISLGMSSRFGVGGVAFRTGGDRLTEVDTVAFGAYSRTAVERCGLLDEELVRNQDDEYNYRLRKLGGRILLSPDIKAKYYSRNSLRSLWRQYYQYGYWKVRLLQKHPRQMRMRQFVPPIFVGTLLGVSLLAPFFGRVGLILALIIGSYVFANLSASIITAWKRGWQYLPILPVVFPILHVSYGMGFLVGLVRFRNRWKRQTPDPRRQTPNHRP